LINLQQVYENYEYTQKLHMHKSDNNLDKCKQHYYDIKMISHEFGNETHYPFLCNECPLNALDERSAAMAAKEVKVKEIRGLSVGRAINEEEIILNACQLARKTGHCTDEAALGEYQWGIMQRPEQKNT